MREKDPELFSGVRSLWCPSSPLDHGIMSARLHSIGKVLRMEDEDRRYSTPLRGVPHIILLRYIVEAGNSDSYLAFTLTCDDQSRGRSAVSYP